MRFGLCECGGILEGVFFEMQESKINGGIMIHTNRYKRACSHMVCQDCGRNHAVDDSFDGDWYTKR